MLVSVVKTLHRTKTAEQLGDMAAYFLKRDNGKSKIAKGILNRAVEMYPTHPELINFKYALTDDTVAFAKDLDRCINLEPSSVFGRATRAELLLEQGNKTGAINDLKEALHYESLRVLKIKS